MVKRETLEIRSKLPAILIVHKYGQSDVSGPPGSFGLITRRRFRTVLSMPIAKAEALLKTKHNRTRTAMEGTEYFNVNGCEM